MTDTGKDQLPEALARRTVHVVGSNLQCDGRSGPASVMTALRSERTNRHPNALPGSRP